MRKGTVKLGADPELFLYDQKTNTFRSAIGLVGGEKKAPRIINEAMGLGVLEDGVAVEFNLNAVERADSFIENINYSFGLLQDQIAQPLKLILSVRSSVEFPAAELKDARALISGCDPDFDAYERGKMRDIIELTDLKNFRCAGGHIHFGYDKENAQTPDWALVQFLDAFALLNWPRHYDASEKLRRRYYGVPGCFRPKEYGLEYRTPSPTWMNFGGHDTQFIQSCQNILAGCLADEVRTREIYDLVDWGDVHKVLSKSFDSNEKSVMALRKALAPFQKELYRNGTAYLTKKTDKKKSAEIMMDEVAAPRRTARQGNLAQFNQFAAQDELRDRAQQIANNRFLNAGNRVQNQV